MCELGDGFNWKWSKGNEPWGLEIGGCEKSRREVWQLLLFGPQPQLWDSNLSIARGRVQRQTEEAVALAAERTDEHWTWSAGR